MKKIKVTLQELIDESEINDREAWRRYYEEEREREYKIRSREAKKENRREQREKK